MIRQLRPTDDAAAPLIGRRLTRRQTIALLGSGLAGGAVLGAISGDTGGSVDAAQITIEAGPDVTQSPGRPTIADIAAALQWDTEQIFRFVADQVAYEPYVGALRGAEGALRAMAGNAVDQSLLLAALLAEAAVPYRFAIGQLSTEGQTALEAELAPTIDELRRRNLRTFQNPAESPAAEATPPVLSPEDEAALEQIVTTAQGLLDLAAAQTDALVTTLSDAIAKAGITLPDVVASPLPDREQREHVWIQVADGPFWIDLDPSVPNAAQKDTFAVAATTLDLLGPELDHLVRVTIVAEEVSGGQPVPRDVVSIEKPSRELITAPIGVGIATPGDFESIGITITNLFEGGETYVPMLVVGDEGVSADAPIGFGGNGGGILGGLSGGDESTDGEALSLGYRLEILSPDADPVTIERTIFDRVDPAQRASGTYDFSTLAPIDDPASDFVRAALRAFTMVSIASAQIAPDLPLDPSKNVFFGSLIYFGQSYFNVRGGLGFDWGTRLGWHPFVDRPNAFAVRFTPGEGEPGTTPVVVEGDILHQVLGWRQTETLAPAETSPWIARGVIGPVAERLTLDPTTWVPDGAAGSVEPGISVGRVFEQVAAQNVQIVALEPSASSQVDLASYSDAAQFRITAALDTGMWVIVPETPVTIGGQDELAWWLIDPATGQITDQLEDGRSGASATIREPRVFYSDFSEYLTQLANTTLKALKDVSCLGNWIGVIATSMAFTIAAGMGDGARATVAGLAGIGQILRMIGACARVIG